MNERILELARQSGGIDMTNHTAGGITTWVGTGTPEFLERFAELIRADEREAMFGATEIDERTVKELRRLHEENQTLRQAADRTEELTEALQDMVVAFGGGGVTESQSNRIQALNRACQILKEKNA